MTTPRVKRVPKAERPRCGARCSSLGHRPCRCHVYQWPDGRLATRCYRHGGTSTGPKTAEGRARCSAGSLHRWAIWRAKRDAAKAQAAQEAADRAALRGPRVLPRRGDDGW